MSFFLIYYMCGDFMTEEMYKRLNNYLNDIFLELNKKDKIFVNNLESIVSLNAIINNFFDIHIEIISKQNNLSFNDIFLLGREIIGKINPKYLNEYDNLIDSGRLDFCYEDISKVSSCFKDDITKNRWININRYFNYDDVISIVHEFFHYTQLGSEYTTYNHEFFTEFISIYFEKIAEKYLLEEKNIPKDEILLNSRIIDFLHSNSNFYKYSVILLAYENLGDINKNTINELNDVVNFEDEIFEQKCIQFLEQLDKINEINKENSINKMTKLVNQNYKYIVGTFFAYYALEHSKIEDMVTLNDKINSEEYSYLGVSEILDTVGIEINYETINETLNIIKNSIYEKKREKTK